MAPPAATSSALVEELSQYGAYHQHPWNKLIHLIFVPLLWATAVLLSMYLPPLATAPFLHVPVPSWVTTILANVAVSSSASSEIAILPVYFDVALILTLAYVIYYIYLDPWGSYLANAMLVTLFFGARLCFLAFDSALAWKYALALHVFGWYAQIHWGHILFEGVRPALVDSFFQSLFLAPLFVCYEAMFWMGLHQDLQQQTEHRIVQRRARLFKEMHKPSV